MSQKNTRYFALRIEKELFEALKERARVEDRSCSSLVRTIIKEYLERVAQAK